MLRQLTTEEVEQYITDDTVRPHLSTEFRISHNREVWGLFEDQYTTIDIPSSSPRSVICVAYCTSIPETEFELAQLSRAPTDSEHELAAPTFDPAYRYPSAHASMTDALEQAQPCQGNLKLWPCGTVTNRFGETMIYDTEGNLAPCSRTRIILDEQDVAVFYTVWSYGGGAGRKLVNQLSEHIRDTRDEISQWVTLSPLTNMAENFHTKNGAVLHSVHDTCQIFDYTDLMRQIQPWTKRL